MWPKLYKIRQNSRWPNLENGYKKRTHCKPNYMIYNALLVSDPDRIRTCDPQLRRLFHTFGTHCKSICYISIYLYCTKIAHFKHYLPVTIIISRYDINICSIAEKGSLTAKVTGAIFLTLTSILNLSNPLKSLLYSDDGTM